MTPVRPDVTEASSTSTETALVLPSQMSTEQHAKWMLDGTIPDQANTEESPASEETAAAGSTPAGEPAPASQPATPQEQKKPKNADTRIQELLAERKELQRKLDEATKRTGDTAAAAAPPPAAAAAAPPPVKTEPVAVAVPKDDPEPNETANPATGKPWKNWSEYKSAQRAWDRRQTARELQASNEQRAQQEQAQKTVNDTIANWRTRCEEAKKEIADFGAVALADSLPFTMSDVVKGYLLQQPLGAKLLYQLAKDGGAEGNRIVALGPVEQLEELVLLKQKLAGGTAAKAPALKTKITSTPEPVTDLGARNGAPADEELAAVSAKDVGAFFRLRNPGRK